MQDNYDCKRFGNNIKSVVKSISKAGRMDLGMDLWRSLQMEKIEETIVAIRLQF